MTQTDVFTTIFNSRKLSFLFAVLFLGISQIHLYAQAPTAAGVPAPKKTVTTAKTENQPTAIAEKKPAPAAVQTVPEKSDTNGEAPAAPAAPTAPKKRTPSAEINVPIPMTQAHSRNRKRSRSNGTKKQGKQSVNRIAVIESTYDPVEKVLKSYRIPYDLLAYRDLEKEELLGKYSAIFVPCGIQTPLETNINILSRGTRIHSVSLKPESREVDKERVAENIEDFIEDGGSAYFSGYSFDILQKAFNPFIFADDFPYLGLSGRVEAETKNDLKRFCLRKKLALYMTHTGWIAPKEVKDAEVIAKAVYSTPRGEQTGPITVLMNRGDGEILYTSYHSTVYSDFRRFNIYRVAGSSLLKKLKDTARQWEQEVLGKIVDAVHKNENSRTYSLPLSAGENTIYFLSEKDPYQVDIYDSKMSLLLSVDSFEKNQEFEIESEKNDICFIKIFPSSPGRFSTHAIISAGGSKIFPYFDKIVIALSIIFGLILIIVLYRIFGPRKYGY
ncbi:MAG: hypothetical protein GY754_23340 [bacterium]|nr:hypothetical protein [bacterium]